MRKHHPKISNLVLKFAAAKFTTKVSPPTHIQNSHLSPKYVIKTCLQQMLICTSPLFRGLHETNMQPFCNLVSEKQ